MNLNDLKNLKNDEPIKIGDRFYTSQDGVIKAKSYSGLTVTQKQTQDTFGFKWKKEDTFNSTSSLARMKDWLLDRYGFPEEWIEKLGRPQPLVLDAGCGAGMSGFEYWGSVSDKITYCGVDISEAVDVAKKRAADKGFKDAIFLQENIANLPFKSELFDIIFSEGVLHHTDDTEKTFNHLCHFLKPTGLFMFYVYRKKGPIREFTDDCIREHLQRISPDEGWESLKSLTKLGIELGKLNIEVNVQEDIDFLGIPAGKIDLQRLFYWYIFKVFYDPNLSFDEMHHINFDWYAPKNAHRHTTSEIMGWCKKNGLEVCHLKEELSGITCIAKKI